MWWTSSISRCVDAITGDSVAALGTTVEPRDMSDARIDEGPDHVQRYA
jgi:hypothetical protein